MKKELIVTSAYAYVTAISGVFITSQNPSGLTVREREVISVLLDYTGGVPINPRINKELWQKFKDKVGLKTQSMSNMMRGLKEKNVVSLNNGFYSLHLILKKNAGLTIKYEVF